MATNHDDAEVAFVCGELQVAKGSLRTVKTLPRIGDHLRFKRKYRVEEVTYSYELNESDNACLTRIDIHLQMDHPVTDQQLDSILGNGRQR